MATFAVILPAAGQSSRFKNNQNRKKPFIELKGRAVWVRSVELFLNREDVTQILIAIAPDDMDWFKQKFQANLAFMDIEIVAGGVQRADSVQNALDKVQSDVEFVVIHDAARPLLVPEWIDKVFDAARQTGAAIPALPVDSTLKRVSADRTIAATVDRTGLWAAQTPQVFRRELLVEAFRKRGELRATDEAQLVEQLGHHVQIVEGWPMNFKITTWADFKMAEAVVDALPKKSLRTLHPFSDEKIRFGD